ncbi:hypothetical protein F0562_020625 [Nyssa sinensis]|uniref:Pentacotripeptide-repeat region of PRORP domain-containing protein n=1 Tax=Nyssa sinensis TaxID=561372 RepID=A0A5J5BTE0_9ASTE|nr:hypothetical protein F0562_020625 [Nyssa sinensis]
MPHHCQRSPFSPNCNSNPVANSRYRDPHRKRERERAPSMATSTVKRTLFSPPSHKHHLVYSFSSLPSDQSPPSDSLISSVVSILKHHRSKSRWNEIHSLYPNGFKPSEVSQITLHLRNNPHLALRFFLFTHRKSLCNHTLLSYSTIIHILSRGRLKTQAQTLIQSAIRLSEPINSSCSTTPPKIFETLVKTYRTCDSAPFVFELLIKACLQSKRIDQSIEIVRMLRSRGIYPTIRTSNSLIESILKFRGCCAGYDMYREIFSFDGEAENRVGAAKVFPSVHTFNIMMLSFYREGLMENVEEIWDEMVKLSCVPNVYSYSVLMAAYCDDEKMGEALKVWEEMRVKDLKHDVVAYNTIIGGFCRIGETGRAEEFFREMELSGVESTCVTFEHLINGYCKIGDVDSAMLLYKDMCRKGFRPESLMVDALIGGLCYQGRVFEALEFLKVAMKSHDMTPKGKSYELLIKGLCQEGKMEEALKLQAEMVGKGFEPNLEIYSAFIDGYMKQGNKDLAGKLRKEMLETQMKQKEN